MKFTKIATLAGIISTGFILSTSTASAVTIYDNGLPSGGTIGAPSDRALEIRADDFSLTGSVDNRTIKSIHWRGWFGDAGTDTEPDDFTIRIYSDVSGPSVQEHQFTIGDAVTRVDTGLTTGVGNGIVYDYSVNVASTTLDAGTTYWISIFNDTIHDLDDHWFWVYGATGVTGNDFASTDGGANWASTAHPVSRSFRLDNESISAVPVPAAVWLMGSALAGLFGFSRKQKPTA